MSSFWDEWYKRFGKKPSIFEEISKMMREMEKEMADTFRSMGENMPERMYRERRLPDGSVRREYGPFVYGYSVKIGPDGKPIIREFGNFKPSQIGEKPSSISLQGQREPLVDIIDEDDHIKIIAELPGVEKREIQLYVTSKELRIQVDNPDRKFYKELELPTEIDESSAVSRYTNGILEVILKKRGDKGLGKRLTIE